MERIKKGRVLHVDRGARRRSWAILAQDFFEKEGGRNKKAAILNQEAHRRPLVSRLRSTPKRAALRASQGFRASRETSDIIHCESWGQVK